MDKYIISHLIIIISCVSCVSSAQEDGLGHNHDHSIEVSDEIVLSEADAQRLGVYTQMVKPREFNEIIKVSGQMESAPSAQSVVAAPSPGIITFTRGLVPGQKVVSGTVIGSVTAQNMAGGDQNEANRIAYESAKLELERVEPLYKEGIVSAKEYNEVKKTYDAAKAAYNGNKTGSKATAVSSGVITQLLVNNGEYVAMGQPIAVISGNETLTLRADLPEKYYNFLPTISTAKNLKNTAKT